MKLNKIEKRLLKVKQPILVGMFEEAMEQYMEAVDFDSKTKKLFWSLLLKDLESKRENFAK